MQFLVVAYDGKDEGALERRLAARPAHIELGNQLVSNGKMLFGVAMVDDSGKMIGSCLICDFINRLELDDWLKIEPYMTGNVWQQVDVLPCKVGPSFQDQVSRVPILNKLVGRWNLESCEHRLSNGLSEWPFGKSPTGKLIYTPDGFMSVMMMNAERKRFVRAGLFEGSTEEKIEAFESFASYSGRYEIVGSEVLHRVEMSLFPNWVGTTQKRFWNLEKNRLILSTEKFVADGNEKIAYLTWRREADS